MNRKHIKVADHFLRALRHVEAEKDGALAARLDTDHSAEVRKQLVPMFAYEKDGRLFLTEAGQHALDCAKTDKR